MFFGSWLEHNHRTAADEDYADRAGDKIQFPFVDGQRVHAAETLWAIRGRAAPDNQSSTGQDLQRHDFEST